MYALFWLEKASRLRSPISIAADRSGGAFLIGCGLLSCADNIAQTLVLRYEEQIRMLTCRSAQTLGRLVAVRGPVRIGGRAPSVYVLLTGNRRSGSWPQGDVHPHE